MKAIDITTQGQLECELVVSASLTTGSLSRVERKIIDKKIDILYDGKLAGHIALGTRGMSLLTV